MRLVGYFLVVALIITTGVAHAQTTHTVSGYLTDHTSGEPLIGTNVYELDRGRGAATNLYGFYSLTLPAGSHRLRFSSLGYRADTVTLLLTQDTIVNRTLAPTTTQLQAVTVVSKNPRIESPQMSSIALRPAEMERLPTLAGEVDLIKVAQLLPGVQSGNEGSSDLIVRGGGPDQNLILLDGVPVYNVGHLLGLVSVFNTDAVKQVDLIKGGFPARYGGRLSSVVDIRLKEGNTQALVFDFELFNDERTYLDIGIVSSQYFQYAQSYSEHLDDQVAFLATPEDVYSNVEGGFGIFAAYYSQTFVVRP